jgi:hypothetical protein
VLLNLERKIPENAIVVILLERLGDIIACEPVIRYFKGKYPDKPVYWVSSFQYQDIFRYHPDVAGFIPIYSKEQYQIWHSNLANITDINYFDYGRSLLEIFSKVAGMEHLNVPPKFYRRPSEK